MSFERWNAFLQEQLGKKQGQTPPQPAQGKNESEVNQMNPTGIIRRIDDLGRIVIPRGIRRTLDIKESDPMEIFINGEDIIIRKYKEESEE